MFVVAIKRIGDFYGKPYPADRQRWSYGQFDNYAGSFSTGYPCFADITHAQKFPTVEEAKRWYAECKRDLDLNPRTYDLNSLCVQEVVFNEVAKLNA